MQVDVCRGIDLFRYGTISRNRCTILVVISKLRLVILGLPGTGCDIHAIEALDLTLSDTDIKALEEPNIRLIPFWGMHRREKSAEQGRKIHDWSDR